VANFFPGGSYSRILISRSFSDLLFLISLNCPIFLALYHSHDFSASSAHSVLNKFHQCSFSGRSWENNFSEKLPHSFRGVPAAFPGESEEKG